MADAERPNYYAILGASREATSDQLKKAFRAIAFECHPDRNPGDAAAAARFKAAAEAYQVLTDPDKRARYDRGDDVALFGASAAREVARRSVQRVVLDHLRNARPSGGLKASATPAPGGTSP